MAALTQQRSIGLTRSDSSAAFPGVASWRTQSPTRSGVSHALETDGLALPLYAALIRMQRKDHAALGGDSSAEPSRHQCPLPVPDTVVYERNFPQGWFTYDVVERSLIRRPGKFLDASAIFEGFRNTKSGSGNICAQFIASPGFGGASAEPAATCVPAQASPPTGLTGSPLTSRDSEAQLLKTKSSWATTAMLPSVCGDGSPSREQHAHHARITDDSGDPRIQVMFFSDEELADFVFSRGSYVNFVKHGILQVFIPPRAAFNDALEVVWSPTACSVNRCVNVTSIASHTEDARLRAATFDGPPHLCNTAATNPLIARQLKAAAQYLSANLLRHEHKSISRIVLRCKQDSKGRLWMLYASSARVTHSSDIVATRKPRVPLSLAPGHNFTIDIREQHGIQDSQLDEAVALRVDMGRDAAVHGSIIAHFSSDPQEDDGHGARRRIQGYRVVPSSLIAAPVTMSIPQCLPSPPRSHAGGASSGRPSPSRGVLTARPSKSPAASYLENLLYRLSESRNLQAAIAIDLATSSWVQVPLVVRLPAWLSGSAPFVVNPDLLPHILVKTLQLTPVDGDASAFEDAVVRAAQDAAAVHLPVARTRRGDVLLRTAAQREINKAVPAAAALSELELLLREGSEGAESSASP